MDDERARELLQSERLRTQQRLDDVLAESRRDRAAANEPGDMFDSAQPLTQEQADDAVMEELQGRLAAIARAEDRLDRGTYGYSVVSGLPIPEDRLESDPTAELTVEESAEAR